MRRCLLLPPSAIQDAAEMLCEALRHHINHEFETASVLLRQANIPEIREWCGTLWGRENAEVHRFRKVDGTPPTLPLARRDQSRMPNSKMKRELIKRDGYICRYCSIPLVTAKKRKKIHNLYPSEVPWDRVAQDQHACFQAMWLQYEHIIPHSRGGKTDLDNMIISCAPCNFGKSERVLEELDLEDPRNRPITKSSWDGLAAF